MGKQISGFDDQAVSGLTEYSWPGNVRQLKNVVERAVILCEKEEVTLKELPLLGEAGDLEQMIENIPATNEELKKIKKEIRRKAIQKVDKNFILNALARNNWNVTQASRETGLQRTNFQSLMKKYGIRRPEKAGGG